MRPFKTTLLITVALAFAGCGQLTVTKARIALVWWSCTEKYTPPGSGSSSCEPSSDAVDNNTGVFVVKGIQELPQENAAQVDIYLDNFRYNSGGSERRYSGNGVATFSKYNDGTWILRKVSIPGKVWDSLDIKAD